MEYVYAGMLLHKAGQQINEANVKNVLEAAHVKVDEARVKALIAALDGVNIDEAVKKAAVQQVAVAAAPAAEAGAGKKAEQKPEKSAEEEKKQEEQAAAGLGALFG